MRSSARAAWRFNSKVWLSCCKVARACSRFSWFFSASMRETISFFLTSSSAVFSASSAFLSSVSSAARAAACSASFFPICATSPLYSASLSRTFLSWAWRSNSTSTSPAWTTLPFLTSRVIIRVFSPWPESRGAAMVCDSTASTIPWTRTLFTKSFCSTNAIRAVWAPMADLLPALFRATTTITARAITAAAIISRNRRF